MSDSADCQRVHELFDLYISEPDLLPPDWAAEASTPDSVETARVVADFIAGMTDRFALREHRKLFDITAMEI